MAKMEGLEFDVIANDQASSKLNVIGSALSKLTKQVSNFAFQITKGFSMFDSFKFASSYEETINRLNLELGEGAKATREYAEEVQKLVGIDIGDWIGTQSDFAILTKGFGNTNKQVEIMSKNLTQLAYDYSSIFDTDVQTAASKLTAAMTGQVKGLKAFGNNVSTAAMQQKLYDKGYKILINDLDSATQAQLRYITIMENASLAKVMNDMSRTVKTPANALRILSANFQVLKRAIGETVSVIFMSLYPALMAIVQGLTLVAKAVSALFGYKMQDIDTGLGSIIDAGPAAEDIEEGLTGGAKAAKEISKWLAPFDELNIIPNQKDRGRSGGSDDTGLQHIDFELPEYDFLKGLEAQDYTAFLREFFKPLAESWDEYYPRISEGFTALKNAWGNLKKTIQDSLMKVFGEEGFLKSISNDLFGGIDDIVQTIAALFQNIKKAWKKDNVGDDIIRSFGKVLKAVSSVFKNLTERSKVFVRNANFTPLLKAIKNLLGALSGVIDVVGELAVDVVDALAKIEFNVLPTLINLVAGALQGLTTVLKVLQPVLSILAPVLVTFFLAWKTYSGINTVMINISKALSGFVGTLSAFNPALGELATVAFGKIASGFIAIHSALAVALPVLASIAAVVLIVNQRIKSMDKIMLENSGFYRFHDSVVESQEKLDAFNQSLNASLSETNSNWHEADALLSMLLEKMGEDGMIKASESNKLLAEELNTKFGEEVAIIDDGYIKLQKTSEELRTQIDLEKKKAVAKKYLEKVLDAEEELEVLRMREIEQQENLNKQCEEFLELHKDEFDAEQQLQGALSDTGGALGMLQGQLQNTRDQIKQYENVELLWQASEERLTGSLEAEAEYRILSWQRQLGQYEDKTEAINKAIASIDLELQRSKGDQRKTLLEIRAIIEQEGSKLEVSAEEVGKHAMTGLSSGIDKNKWRVTNAAQAVAKAASEALKKALEIKSPSKVTAETGKFFSEGLAQGIKSMSNHVAKAAKDIGIVASDSLEGAIDPVSPTSAFTKLGTAQMGDISQNIAQAITANGTLKITVPVVLDGREIGEAVVDYNNGIVMRTGASPLMI